jgi:hypothetical protein
MDRRRKHHTCNANGEWSYCCVCDGRIHLDDCTTRKDQTKDCCPKRHKMLFDNGHVRGLGDSSMAMWSETEPYGYHDPK